MSVLGLFGFSEEINVWLNRFQLNGLLFDPILTHAITWKSFWSSSQVEDNGFENHLLYGGQADSWLVRENRYKHSRTSVKEVKGRTIVVGRHFGTMEGAGVHYLQMEANIARSA